MNDDDFSLATEIAIYPGDAFNAAWWQELQKAIHAREDIEIGQIGARAWAVISPVERAEALPGLWRAHYYQVMAEQDGDFEGGDEQ